MATIEETKKLVGLLERMLSGVLAGKLTLQVFPVGSRKVARKPAGRPGRKPLSAVEKARRLRARVKDKRREMTRRLPSLRDLRLFLHEHPEGSRITDIARHFGVKRTWLQPVLTRGLKTTDLEVAKGLFYNGKPIRTRGHALPKSGPSYTPTQICDFLETSPGASLQDLAHHFKTKYQRFIRLTNRLVKEGTLVRDGVGLRVA